MKIALVCTTLGHAWRGFERFTYELFNQLKEEIPVTLFSCRENRNANEVSFPILKHDRFLRMFSGKRRDNYYFSQLSYALSFIPFVAWHNFDIVHYSETGIGNFLFHAKRLFGFRFKLIFTDALGLDPYSDKTLYQRQDCSQAVTLPHYEQLIGSGVDRHKIAFIPYGINSGHYMTKMNKQELRLKYGIPREKFVILSVAALNRRHKRTDYLIQEVARLDKKCMLISVGQPEEPDLIRMGEELLGENFKTFYVPFDQMPDIYGLADLFVSPSLVEGFGLALVEAMTSSVPIIAHDSFHFQWIVGDHKGLADLSKAGSLVEKIKEIVENYDTFKNFAEANRVNMIKRFDWSVLKHEYIKLYESVLSKN